MLGKSLFVASAMFALFMATRSKYPMYMNSLVISTTSSWGQIEHARKRNNRNKAQKRKRGYHY